MHACYNNTEWLARVNILCEVIQLSLLCIGDTTTLRLVWDLATQPKEAEATANHFYQPNGVVQPTCTMANF